MDTKTLKRRQGLPGEPVAPTEGLSGALSPRYPGLRSPVISIDPPSSTVRPGQDASFRCLIHEGALPISLEWKTRNQELEGEQPAGKDWAYTGRWARHKSTYLPRRLGSRVSKDSSAISDSVSCARA